ncbi:MAG: transaldolase family protein [Phycisphaerae bacterium]|nr:transaldolase family protein [Phycisphaerae bacterium]
MANKATDRLADPLTQLVLEDFTPHFDQLRERFPDNPRWRKLADVGTELWLDSGDIEAIGRLWARPFTAVTTNNTLLNKEVQRGQYDELIKRAATIVRARAGRKVDDRELIQEIAFVLNARHALRLVEAFDAFVSVEEHTDLAHDVEGAVRFARRYHAVCPQRFLVKIPLTAAGLIAARRCHDEGIGVNLTLGFSARQNYLAARFARPRFVNVFLGRLNQFVTENELGDGKMVGEKATLASRRAVAEAAEKHHLPTRQIAASIRFGEQIVDLAGVDVMTIPIAAAEQYLALPNTPLTDRRRQNYRVEFADLLDVEIAGFDDLWDVPDVLVEACDELDRRDPKELEPGDLVSLLEEDSMPGLLVNWPAPQVQLAQREGKIPNLHTWQEGLADGEFGLDALMNLAGLASFAQDQAAMDDRVRAVLGS